MRFLLFFLWLIPSLTMAHEMKILTWNVFMLPKPIKFSMQKERTKLITNTLKTLDHDVIILEEAFSSTFRKQVGQGLKAKYPHQYVLPKSRRFLHVMNSGVFILSRHPLKKLGHWYYNQCAVADCFAAKGVVLVEVTTPANKKIQIAATHMQAHKEYASIRKNQLKEMKALLDHHATQGIPQFLIGDLNIDAHSLDEYPEALKMLEMTNSSLEGQILSTSGHDIECYKVPRDSKKDKWLDHIWLRDLHSNSSVVNKKVLVFEGNLRGNTCFLSDHHAVEAKINL